MGIPHPTQQPRSLLPGTCHLRLQVPPDDDLWAEYKVWVRGTKVWSPALTL